MQSLTSILLSYSFIELLLFSFCIGAGHIFTRRVMNKQFAGFFSFVFFNALAGCSLCVFFFSVICTSGRTVFLLFIPLLIFYLIERSKDRLRFSETLTHQKGIFNISHCLFLLLIILLVFAWQASVVLKTEGFPVDAIEKDSFFYAEIGKCMVTSGVENTFTTANLSMSAYHFPSPYHYFDIWLGAFVSSTLGLNYALVLLLNVYTFFAALLACGFLALLERYRCIRWYHLFLALALLFVSGIYASEGWLGDYHYKSQMEGLLERYGGKLGAIYCFTLAALLLWIEDKSEKGAVLLLLSLPLLSIAFAPGIFGGLTLFALIRIWRNRQRAFYLRVLLFIFLLSLIILLFYKVYDKQELNYRLDKPLMDYTDLNSLSWFRLKFFLVELFLKTWAHPIYFVLNYFPFLLPLLFLLWRNKADPALRSFFFLLACVWLCGLLSFNSFYLMDDAFQLYVNALAMWHVLFAGTFVYLLVRAEGLIAKTVQLLFLLALVFNASIAWTSYKDKDDSDYQFSDEYLEAVNGECAAQTDGMRGATFYDKSFYNNPLISYPLEYYCMPFIFRANVFTPFNLSPPDIPQQWNRHQIEKNILKAPFTQFLNKHGYTDSLTLQKLQIRFIRENKVNYLICPAGQDLRWLDTLGIKRVIADRQSGQRFVLLGD